jgi:hypothetical protein
LVAIDVRQVLVGGVEADFIDYDQSREVEQPAEIVVTNARDRVAGSPEGNHGVLVIFEFCVFRHAGCR